MVLPDSHKVSRAPWYSGILIRSSMHFAYGAITHYGQPFQIVLLHMKFVTSRITCKLSTQKPTTPYMQRSQTYTHKVWALPVSLAATSGIVVTFCS